MDSDEFVDGVHDEIKYERDLYRDAVVNVNGTRMVVSKAPFFEVICHEILYTHHTIHVKLSIFARSRRQRERERERGREIER
jgi:hypothetical protein